MAAGSLGAGDLLTVRVVMPVRLDPGGFRAASPRRRRVSRRFVLFVTHARWVLIVARGLAAGRLVALVEDGRGDPAGPALLVAGSAHEQKIVGVAVQRHDPSGKEVPGERACHEGAEAAVGSRRLFLHSGR